MEACRLNQVSDIIVPGVSKDTWQKTIDLCNTTALSNDNAPNSHKQKTQLHLALGLHPIFIDQHQPQHLNLLNEIISSTRPIAVGEIGLDFYLKNLDREKQQVFFAKQLIIAKQNALPAIIHVRKAHDECLNVLSEVKVEGGIIHNFNGSIQHAHKYIELGFKLGFGGMLTFSRSRVIRNLAKQIPLEAIVLETDAPDLTVEAHKGERNSPEFLPHVLQALAEVKNITAPEIARITSENARSVLKLQH